MINRYGKWKLIYRDEKQCFSEAIDKKTNEEVIVITHFDSSLLSKPVKLLVSDALYQHRDSFEDESGFHIVLQQLKGTPLKQFMKTATKHVDYRERTQMAYQWIKSIASYDPLPDAIKIQLVDADQLIVNSENMLMARECINYNPQEAFTWTQVFKELAETLHLLLPDAPLYQKEFLDRLLIGKHENISFTLFRKNFKQIFLYESDEAIKNISFEYNIILNDIHAGPPISMEPPEAKASSADEVDQEYLDDSFVQSTKDFSEKSMEESAIENSIIEDPLSDETIDENILVFSEDDLLKEDISEDQEKNLTDEEPEEALASVNEDDDDLKLYSPQVTKTSKFHFTSEDLLEDNINDLFSDEDRVFFDEAKEDPPFQTTWKHITSLFLVILVTMVALFFMGHYFLKPSQPLIAQFDARHQGEILKLKNTSVSHDDAFTYHWEIFYNDQLVQTHEARNITLSFVSDGQYRIKLHLKNEEGIIVDTYEYDYLYVKERND